VKLAAQLVAWISAQLTARSELAAQLHSSLQSVAEGSSFSISCMTSRLKFVSKIIDVPLRHLRSCRFKALRKIQKMSDALTAVVARGLLQTSPDA
jgi:hypothetical protein